MRIRLLAGAMLLPAVAASQTQHPKLDVAVRVASVAVSGDTIEIGYVVKNRPGSRLPLWIFGISTRARVVSVTAPADRRGWTTDRARGAEAMPHWGAMRTPVVSGDSTLPLRLRAVGVTDFVEFLAVPDLTQVRDTIEDDKPHDQWREAGTTGTVLGVVPPPANQTPAQQMTRILGFMTRSCGADDWITDRGVCASLSDKLRRAAEAIAAGSMTGARTHLSAFLAELDAQHGTQPGKHVTDIAYALLKPNVAYLMR